MSVRFTGGQLTTAQQPTSPLSLLEPHRNAAYTTALLTGKHEIIDWPFHVQRLQRSVAELTQPWYPNLSSWQQRGSPAVNLDRAIEAAVVPPVKQALEAFNQLPDMQGTRGMMMVVVADGDPSTDGSPPVDVSVLCQRLPERAAATGQGEEVVVLGRPRRIGMAKYSDWVRERKQWEVLKPPSACEVLLSDEAGALLEGLTTNFFVVAPSETAPGNWALVTAPDASNALPGVVKRRVIEAARLLGLEVRERAPVPQERELWREAFITNCLRVVHPIKRVSCPEGNAWGHAAWDCTLPHAPGPVTQALADKYYELATHTTAQQLL